MESKIIDPKAAKYEGFGEVTYATVCFCGLRRLLPQGTQIGDEVHLVPCPRCGNLVDGVFTADGIHSKY